MIFSRSVLHRFCLWSVIFTLSFSVACGLSYTVYAEEGDHIVISKVLYDPSGTESGGEAVEIFNPTDLPIDISGWQLRTESSVHDATIPATTLLESGRYYLIADAGWSEKKDSENWPDANLEEAITLYNSDSGVALVDGGGAIVDAVGWGDVLEIEEGLYESVPALPVEEGMLLARSGDSGNNFIDLFATSDGPKNNDFAEDVLVLDLEVVVENSPMEVLALSILDNGIVVEDGSVVSPVAATYKELDILVVLEDEDGFDQEEMLAAVLQGPDLLSVPLNISVESCTDTLEVCNFTGKIKMAYYFPPGNYTLDVACAEGEKFNFLYGRLLSIFMDASTLKLLGVSTGESAEISGDYAFSTEDRPTLRNAGNVPVTISYEMADLMSGSDSLSATNVQVIFDGEETVMLEPGEDSVVAIGIKVNVPANTPSGNYSGGVKMVASN